MVAMKPREQEMDARRPSRPYPAYRPSGVAWLGDVPTNWEMRRFKYLLHERDDRSADGSEQLLRVSQYSGVTERKRVDGEAGPDTRAASLVGYKCVRRHDLVVNIMLAWNGSLGISQFHGIASPAYCVYQFLADAHPWFFHYLLRSQVYRSYIKTASTGVVDSRLRLYTDDLYQLYTPVPPLPEQTAIVRYLDYADRRIRRYVGAKRKLIALLEEEKQAVINQAVTRGLDPDVPLKPSGVEWLDDVPAHWEVRRLRHLIEGKPKYGANAAAEYDNPAWPRYLRITDFDLDGQLRNEAFRSLPPAIAEDYMVQSGDILFARSGATVGKTFLVSSDTGEACHAGYLIRVRPRCSLIDPKYLFSFTQSATFAKWKNSTFIIATIQNISAEKYSDLYVPVPPPSEQTDILCQLSRSSSRIDGAIARTHRQIDLVQEYRTRLIADVVTGKLDVREAAAQLPEEDDDQDPIGNSTPSADDLPSDLYDIDESVEDSVVEEEVTA